MIFTNAGQVSLQSKNGFKPLRYPSKNPLERIYAVCHKRNFCNYISNIFSKIKEKDVRETKTLTSQTVDKVAKPCRAIKRNSFKHGISFDLS